VDVVYSIFSRKQTITANTFYTAHYSHIATSYTAFEVNNTDHSLAMRHSWLFDFAFSSNKSFCIWALCFLMTLMLLKVVFSS